MSSNAPGLPLHHNNSVQRRTATTSSSNGTALNDDRPHIERRPTTPVDGRALDEKRIDEPMYKYAWRRFRGTDRKLPTVGESLKNMATHTILNVLFVFVPVSWAVHFVVGADGEPRYGPEVRFSRAYNTRLHVLSLTFCVQLLSSRLFLWRKCSTGWQRR